MPEDEGTLEMERREMPRVCPACGGELTVTELCCPPCQATIRGQFSAGLLARLTKEQQEFLLVFVHNRGNIREVQRVLDLSYPTVRARLDRVIEALDYADARVPPAGVSALRQEILNALDQGKITAGEAVERLKAPCRWEPKVQ